MINIVSIVSGITGIVIGFIVGRYVKNHTIKRLFDYLNDIFRNLDNYVMAISALIVVVSIVLSVTGKLETFASVTINVFGTVVFSWLLTKKSSKEEFREHEQDLALRAYRHINYLESAANSAYKTLEEFKADDNIDKEVKLMLGNAMNQINYIKGGINTCKMDWVDMLSPEQQAQCRDKDGDEFGDYGMVQKIVISGDINQEDV